METLSGDVSMEVVKFEFSADSRNLHCRTRSRDSTSEVARDRNVRALRERSPVMILYRNLSFMMRIRALMEGHWSAMRAMLFAVYLWSRRILLASSVWKDSRLASKALLRIHDSAPYRRQGRTQCSIMFLDDRGFSFPRKTPLPLAKKALLAFSMLLSTHFLQERLGHHSAPRHLAELVTGIFSCPAEMCVVLAGVEGEIMASHLSTFSVRPWDVANLWTLLT